MIFRGGRLIPTQWALRSDSGRNRRETSWPDGKVET